MATFEEQFENHPIHDGLAQLEAAISQDFKHKLDDVAVDNIDRLRQAVAYIRSSVESASPVLNSAARLSGIQKGIQAALNEVNQFISNGNSAHLANASNQIDGPIANCGALALLADRKGLASAKDAVSFKKLAQEVISDLRTETETAKAKNHELLDKISELKNSLSELRTQLEGLEGSATAKLGEIESSFKAEETERDATFKKAETDRTKAFDDAVEAWKKQAADSLNELDSKKTEAERIVQLVGNVGLTGNYQGAGKEEKLAADRLRSLALFCFGGTFIVIAATLFASVIEGFDPWQAFFRLGAALFLLVPGGYAARESSRHRVLENRHRRAELELATINAYLDDLPPDQKHKIKAELTAKFFGKELPTEASPKGDISGSKIVGLLEKAIDALSNK